MDIVYAMVVIEVFDVKKILHNICLQAPDDGGYFAHTIEECDKLWDLVHTMVFASHFHLPHDGSNTTRVSGFVCVENLETY
mgnify:CR=1 FL=1